MQSLFSSPNPPQSHTREIVAPANCSSFTPDQERALDAAYMAWVNARGTFAEATYEARYVELRKSYQYVNMTRGL